MTKLKILLVIFTLTIGLLLRLYKINSPVADWHSFRQADTASVTKIFSQQGIDLLHPKYHDLSNTQSGLNNPNGYRMVELPIYNAISVYFHNIFNTNIDISSRLVSIIFSLGSALLIFMICYQQTKLFLRSFFGLVIFLFLPFNIYYSRTILPEPTTVFFMLLSLYFLSKNIFISALTLAIAVLLKPYTAIILFPVIATYLIIHRSKYLNFKSIIKLVLFCLISFIPFILWRIWIGKYPEGIPKSDWLLNDGVTNTFPAWFHGYSLSFLNKLVAFRPHWWQWLFAERIANLILGTFGIIPLFLGLAFKKNRTQTFSVSLVLGILLYFIVVAQGNIQHDYYQVLIIPFISILLGFGYYYITKFLFGNTIAGITSLIIIFCFSTYFSFIKINEYYKINNQSIITAGQKVDEITPKNSIIIAPYNGDTAFLYQTNRTGFPIEIYDFNTLKSEFANRPIYFVSVNFDDYTNKVIKQFPTVYRDSQFIILNINK